jgi:hypothetical protein
MRASSQTAEVRDRAERQIKLRACQTLADVVSKDFRSLRISDASMFFSINADLLQLQALFNELRSTFE